MLNGLDKRFHLNNSSIIVRKLIDWLVLGFKSKYGVVKEISQVAVPEQVKRSTKSVVIYEISAINEIIHQAH